MFVETMDHAKELVASWENAVKRGEVGGGQAASILRYCGATHPNRELGDFILYAAQEFDHAR